MRLLFEIDAKNYDVNWKKKVRPSARAIIIKDRKIAVVHSLKYDYYKFPGGGIDKDESNIDAVIRETKEEAGLIVIKESIKEFGLVKRIDSYNNEEIFIQDNYYYLCSVTDEVIPQKLDEYENDEKFTLEFVSPEVVISTNRKKDHGPKSEAMILREAKVMEILINEGYFN